MTRAISNYGALSAVSAALVAFGLIFGVAAPRAAEGQEEDDSEAEVQGSMSDFARANATRWSWLNASIPKLEALKAGTGSADTLKSVQSWMHLGSAAPTTAQLDTLIQLFKANRASSSAATMAPRECPFSSCCGATDYACTETTGSRRIHFLPNWVAKSSLPVCQATIATHEYFHSVGAVDIPDPKDSTKSTCHTGNVNTAQALTSADCLGGLACELGGAAGCDDPC